MPNSVENRVAIREAWKEQRLFQTPNFGTRDGEVWSYLHRIGWTDENGKRHVLDCHASRTTSFHAHVLFPAADVIEPCPEHPKAPRRGKLTQTQILAGIRQAIVDLDFAPHMPGIAACNVRDGLKNLLDGKEYHAKPHPAPARSVR